MASYTAGDLEMANRHVAEGEQRVRHQEEILARIRSGSFPTDQAERLLRSFKETLEAQREHRDAIAAALGVTDGS